MDGRRFHLMVGRSSSTRRALAALEGLISTSRPARKEMTKRRMNRQCGEALQAGGVHSLPQALLIITGSITGSIGAGKTSVLDEASDILALRSIEHAAID